MEGYGWLNTLYDVAQTGLFTEKSHNAINSVKRQNVYEVFTYLSWSSAKVEYENAVRKGLESDAIFKADNRKRK